MLIVVLGFALCLGISAVIGMVTLDTVNATKSKAATTLANIEANASTEPIVSVPSNGGNTSAENQMASSESTTVETEGNDSGSIAENLSTSGIPKPNNNVSSDKEIVTIDNNGSNTSSSSLNSGNAGTQYIEREVTPSGVTHVVTPFDTLSGLSLRYGVSVDAIAKLNHIEDVNMIYDGSVLLIPKAE